MKVKNKEKTRFGVLPETISIKIREPGSAITHFLGLILIWIGAGRCCKEPWSMAA